MERLDFYIDGFKCHLDTHIELNNMTLLTGANASGKSSVIQALLLMSLTCEQMSNGQNTARLPLNTENYALELGNIEDIINEAKDTITLKLQEYGIFASLDEKENTEKGFLHVKSVNPPEINPLNGQFLYLCAERQGPRYIHKLSSIPAKDACDCHGSDVATIINNNELSKISPEKFFVEGNDSNFGIQLDTWLDYIFPGVKIQLKYLSDDTYQIKLLDSHHSSVAPNTGFGISYVLPILVDGLLAPEGSMLVIENPEAHLHAKSQSNIGYFLGKMASAGVRIVLETHSEHIVNGVRRAVVHPQIHLSPDDVNIYYFKSNDDKTINPQKITIDNEGNLSDFPLDFFDQNRQDLLEIINKTQVFSSR